MNRLTGFIRRERLYLLLLAFILTVNALVLIPAHDKARSRRVERAALTDAGASVTATERAEAFRQAEERRRSELEKAFREDRQLGLIFALTSLLIMAVFLLGFAIDLLIVGARLSGRPLDIYTYRNRPVGWGPWDVAKVVILFLFFGYIFIMVESVLAGAIPVIKDDNFRMIFNTTVMDALGAVFIIYFAVVQHGERLAALGLSLKNFARNVFYGITAYIALMPVLAAILGATAVFVNMIKYVPPKQPVVELFLKETNAPFLFYTSLFAAVLGPVIEELFFRGFMYNALKRRLGIVGAMVVTAAFFAALHAHAVGFLPILALGIALAYIYEKTGTLVAPITVHVTHNLAMVFLVFLVKRLGVG